MRRISYFLSFSIIIISISCTTTNEKIKYYIGEDLPTKKWNAEYGMPLIYLKDTYSFNSAKHANRYLDRNMPKFVLYENGQLIYGILENDKVNYYETVLSQDEIDNIFTELKIPENNFFENNNVNAVSTWSTDRPITLLIINRNYQKIITVYGSLSEMYDNKKKYHKKLLDIYNNLINYKNKNAKKWMPDNIEFLLNEWTSAEYTNNWPENFPDLFSADTIKFNDNRYVLFIKRELHSEFMDYLIEISEKAKQHIDGETIIINGKKMLFGYKIPLPNIKYWYIQ
jgi:hypothetical protein